MIDFTMQDPSQGIQRELVSLGNLRSISESLLKFSQLPHVHLLSAYRFPVLQSVHHNKITEWLLSAPKIVRETSPFYWTYLDRLADGTILLTWQPLDSLGINFASDGYIWPAAETAFQLEVEGGYVRWIHLYSFNGGLTWRLDPRDVPT